MEKDILSGFFAHQKAIALLVLEEFELAGEETVQSGWLWSDGLPRRARAKHDRVIRLDPLGSFRHLLALVRAPALVAWPVLVRELAIYVAYKSFGLSSIVLSQTFPLITLT